MALLYESLVDTVEYMIGRGVYDIGARMPSLRLFSQQHGVSVSTSVRVYHELERRGALEARPRAGFYVRDSATSLEVPRMAAMPDHPVPVTGRDRILRLLDAANERGMVNFGAATPHVDFMPGIELERASRRVWRNSRRRCMRQEFPPGSVELRTQVARRLARARCCVTPNDLVITSGAQAAIALSLRLLTSPGDVVAVESPTYYGLLEVIEQLGLRAIPIPTDPEQGISLDALAIAFQDWPIKACVLVPTFSNPLGFCMTDDRKRDLLAIAHCYDVAIVEDDVYGEFPIGQIRPRPLKSWDKEGTVFYCGSATKAFSAGLRIGWLWVPPHLRERARYLQYVSTVSVQTHGQLTLADYLARHNVERSMSRAAQRYTRARAYMARQIEKLFPPNTKITRPNGGYLLWVELSPDVDTTELMAQALERGISIAPGELFSVNGQFNHCLRLNSAVNWAGRSERALARLAALID